MFADATPPILQVAGMNDPKKTPRLNPGRQYSFDFRHHRRSILQPIAHGRKENHGEIISRQVLLMPDTLIHRYEYVEHSLRGVQQFSVSHPRPPHSADGSYFVGGVKEACQTPIQVLVEQDADQWERGRGVVSTASEKAYSRKPSACSRLTLGNPSRNC